MLVDAGDYKVDDYHSCSIDGGFSISHFFLRATSRLVSLSGAILIDYAPARADNVAQFRSRRRRRRLPRTRLTLMPAQEASVRARFSPAAHPSHDILNEMLSLYRRRYQDRK